MTPNQQIELWLGDRLSACTRRERPFVTLSYAQSWDGSITLRSGASMALSGEQSALLTHQLRSLHDGIMVGIGTVLSDDPRLNVRLCAGRDPQPVVLDAQLRMPPQAKLCHLPDKRCWLITSSDSTVADSMQLDIIRLAGDSDGRVCLHQALAALKQRGINSLMVEGGAGVISSFLRQKLVDAIVLTVAPRLVGGYKAVTNLGVETLAELPEISPMFTEKLGKDLIMWGDLRYPAS
jgi:riboflavin-specific deaminase-like protein